MTDYSFSERFIKSRNRIIYFLSAGFIFMYYPIKAGTDFVPFGIPLDGVDSEAMVLFLGFIATILFFWNIFLMIEEWPILKGFKLDILARTQEIETIISRYKDDFRKVADDQRMLLSKIDQIKPQIQEVLENFDPKRHLDKEFELQLLSSLKNLEECIHSTNNSWLGIQHVKDFVPLRDLPTKIVRRRLQMEFWLAPILLSSFWIIYLKKFVI